MIKKIFSMAAILLTLFSPITFAADDTATDNEPRIVNVAPDQFYEYTSPTYGYTIRCPWKPVATDLKFETPALKGEKLFFLNDKNEPLFYYVIELDAFDGKAVPDFNTADQKAMDDYMKQLQEANLFELTLIVNVTNTNKGVFAITAKELEMTNEKGEVETMTASNQAAVTFFRTPSGKCMSVAIFADDLTAELIDVCRYSVTTFKDR